MNSMITTLKSFWAELESERRTWLIAIVGVSLFAILAVGYWSLQTPWSTLQRGQPETLGELSSVLQEAGIEARVTDEGALQVPSAKRASALAALKQSTNPNAIDPLEHVLGPPRMHDWAMIRAAENQIAQTLNRFDGVIGSRVSLVAELEALFTDEAKPASASVFLQVAAGQSLNDDQVTAIVNTVVHSMRGLKPDHISVVDHRGTVLHHGGTGINAENDQAKRLVNLANGHQSRVEDNVTRALRPVLGFDGAFSVAVTVDLDPTSSETHSRRLDPDSRVAITETLEEKNTRDMDPGGVPGVDAHLAERPAEPVNSRTMDSTVERMDYDVSEVADHTVRPAGSVRRVSVAVQVDAARVAAIAESANMSERAVEERIAKIVQTAAGIDAERMDEVIVTSLPFADPGFVTSTGPVAMATVTPDAWLPMVPYLVVALALVLVFFFVVRPVMKVVLNPTRKAQSANSPFDGRLQANGESPEHLSTRLRALVDAYQPIDDNDLNRLVGQQSQASATVLRRWHGQ